VDTLAERVAAARSALEAQIYFDFDRSDLTDSARAVLDSKIPLLQANPTMRIRIEGNTDPRGSDEYNLALGQRRANSARRYLVQRGIAANRFETTSRGEENRNCTEEDESCYAQNRRDEFVIIIGGENIQLPPQ
jgi:peptidoglycan-associated lipoprotein